MHMYKLPAACEARGQDVAGVGDQHEEREEEERGQRLGEASPEAAGTPMYIYIPANPSQLLVWYGRDMKWGGSCRRNLSISCARSMHI